MKLLLLALFSLLSFGFSFSTPSGAMARLKVSRELTQQPQNCVVCRHLADDPPSESKNDSAPEEFVVAQITPASKPLPNTNDIANVLDHSQNSWSPLCKESNSN